MCLFYGERLEQSPHSDTSPSSLSSSDPQSNKALALQSRLHLHHPGGLHGDSCGGRLCCLPGEVPGAAVQPHHLICQPAAGWVTMTLLRLQHPEALKSVQHGCWLQPSSLIRLPKRWLAQHPDTWCLWSIQKCISFDVQQKSQPTWAIWFPKNTTACQATGSPI